MYELLIKNATLPDGRSGMDVAVKDGLVKAVTTGIEHESHQVIDARGYLLSPPFVDPHFHMDAAMSLGQPRLNRSGTLLEVRAQMADYLDLQLVAFPQDGYLRCPDAGVNLQKALDLGVDETIEAYSRAVRRVSDYFDCCPDKLKPDQLEQHFADLVESHSWSTVKLDRNGLQFFWKHVLKLDWKWVDIVKP